MSVQSQLEKVEGNIYYRMIATFLTPAAIGIGTSLFMVSMGDIKDSQKELKQAQQLQAQAQVAQALDMNTIKGDVKELRGRMDYAVLTQLQQVDRRLEKVETIVYRPARGNQ